VGFFSFMNHSEAIKYLYSLGNEVLTAKLGLRNIAALLNFLGDPHKKFKSILIAGTNGKGSVAAFCESVLRASGYRTGLYTSPHLIQIEERICVGGVMITGEVFARLTEEVKDAVSSLRDEGGNTKSFRLDPHPTYFEMVTAIAFKYFAEQHIDIAVLEVGLGGRLDATNVVDPLVDVITNIDYDHQKYLGDSIAEIAAEKAGTIKPRSYETAHSDWVLTKQKRASVGNLLPVVLCNANEAVLQVIEKRCEATGAVLIRTLEDFEYEADARSLGYFRLRLGCSFESEIEIDLPLPGKHQVLNALTAIRTLEILKSFGYEIKRQNVVEGIAKTCWPGRLEVLNSRPRIIFDGAHNPAGAQKVRDYVEQFLGSNQIVMIYGTMRDKAIQEIAQKLFPLAHRVILTRPEWERAADPIEIGNLVPEFQPVIRLSKDVQEALDIAHQLTSENDTILIVGSLFLVGDAKKCIQRTVVR
jgi:dihydrofolate synthase/folylpolyglutamate synthase